MIKIIELFFFKKYCDECLKILFNRIIKLNDMSLLNMKNTKIRKYGDIYNFENIEALEEKKIKMIKN
jgi:hypothetical protein